MLLRQKILYAALPLGCLLLHGQAQAGGAMEDPRQPPLKIVNYTLRAQVIEPTKLGTVPAPAMLAAREEDTTQAEPETPVPVPKLVGRVEASSGDSVALDIVPWQRDCAAMGYPADYLGIVTGETWRDRRDGLRRDVWLSNNCVAPQAEPETTAMAAANLHTDLADDMELLAARQPPEAQLEEQSEATDMITASGSDAPPPTALESGATATALVTPRLPGVITEETIHQAAELHSTAALVTPRLENLAMNHDPAPGVTNYRPATPIRAGSGLTASALSAQGWLDDELREITLAQDDAAPADDSLQRLELLGQKLAVNRLARVTVTAYASMTPERDSRAARRLSLNRALAVRDALMLGGAGSEQVRLRALGANVPSGQPDRIDIGEN